MDTKIAVLACNDLFFMPSETNREDRLLFNQKIQSLISKDYSFVTSSVTYETLPPKLKELCSVVRRGEKLPKGQVCVLDGPTFIEGHWQEISEFYITFIIGNKSEIGGSFKDPRVLKILRDIKESVGVHDYKCHSFEGKNFYSFGVEYRDDEKKFV